jgi:hypothetical protein
VEREADAVCESRQVTIVMEAASADALAASGYALYAFAAVQCADATGLPLVWLRTVEYSALTYLEWWDEFAAYTSFSPLAPGARVQEGFTAPAEPGQTLTVTARTGTGTVGAGPPAEITVVNATQTRFTCGVSRRHGDGRAPVCALPLYGGGVQAVVPLPRLLLMFSTAALQPGTAVASSTGPSVVLDASAACDCTVRFDINLGWSGTGACPAQPVPVLSPLAPILLVPSSPPTRQVGGG